MPIDHQTWTYTFISLRLLRADDDVVVLALGYWVKSWRPGMAAQVFLSAADLHYNTDDYQKVVIASRLLIIIRSDIRIRCCAFFHFLRLPIFMFYYWICSTANYRCCLLFKGAHPNKWCRHKNQRILLDRISSATNKKRTFKFVIVKMKNFLFLVVDLVT